MSSLKALIERRDELRRRIDRYQRELDVVERQLFARVEKVAAILEGELSASGSVRIEQPTEQKTFRIWAKPEPPRQQTPGELAAAGGVKITRPTQSLFGSEVSAAPARPPAFGNLSASNAFANFSAGTVISAGTFVDGTKPRIEHPDAPSFKLSFPHSALPDMSGVPSVQFHRVTGAESFGPTLRTGERISAAAEKILRRERRPLRTADLYEKLRADGVEIPGVRPKNNLAAHLSNTTTIVSTPHGWTLRIPPEDDIKKEDPATPA